MKTKLTLTIEESLIPLSKELAKKRGTSLSTLVEESLKHQLKETTQSFSEKWKGAFGIDQRLDSRRSYLSKRYKL